MPKIIATISGWTLIDDSTVRPTTTSSEWPSEAPTRNRSTAPTTPAPYAGTDLDSCKMYAAVSVRGGLAAYIEHVQ